MVFDNFNHCVRKWSVRFALRAPLLKATISSLNSVRLIIDQTMVLFIPNCRGSYTLVHNPHLPYEFRKYELKNKSWNALVLRVRRLILSQPMGTAHLIETALVRVFFTEKKYDCKQYANVIQLQHNTVFPTGVMSSHRKTTVDIENRLELLLPGFPWNNICISLYHL